MVVRKRLNLSGPAMAFITTTVFEWKPVLTRAAVANIVINELEKTQSVYKLNIVSYVLMPSHIHLLIWFSNIKDLSKCVQSFKSITSRRVKRLSLSELAENSHKLWKPRFDDLIITSEKQMRIKMEYIHNNPVRAGLVENAEEWRYSSAVDWLTPKRGLISIARDFQWMI